MKTFNEFVEHKALENLVYETAELMVELDINPPSYILSYVSSDPVVETALLKYIELNEGMWDNIKNSSIGRFGQRVWDAGSKFAGNVWSGGGILGGAKQATDALMGPKAKFDTAVKVLSDLVDSLMKNDATKNMMTADNKTTVWKYISGVKKQLEQQKEMIPALTSQTNTQPYMAQPGRAAPPAP